MKRVFRIWKMLQCDLEISPAEVEDTIACLKNGWPQRCDGKTVDECAKMGFAIVDSWLVQE